MKYTIALFALLLGGCSVTPSVPLSELPDSYFLEKHYLTYKERKEFMRRQLKDNWEERKPYSVTATTT